MEKVDIKLDFDLNKFLKTFRLKKQYIKKLKSTISLVSNVKKVNHKHLNVNLSGTSMTSQKTENHLVMYIISIIFSKTNTLMHVMDFSGSIKFFYSAGSFHYKGKSKKARSLVLKNFYQVLITKLNFLKGKPIAIHLKNVGFNRFWIVKTLKKKFFIKVVRNFNNPPFNGCRKKKLRRKKF